jgi:hypothetical protein
LTAKTGTEIALIEHEDRKPMTWIVRCKKCGDPIENDDKSVEITPLGKNAIMTIRAYCNWCNISTHTVFNGDVVFEPRGAQTRRENRKRRR